MSGFLLALQPLANQAAEFMMSSEGHHATPSGSGEYLITAVGTIIVLVVIYATIDYFVRPREKDDGHIKRRILEDRL